MSDDLSPVSQFSDENQLLEKWENPEGVSCGEKCTDVQQYENVCGH